MQLQWSNMYPQSELDNYKLQVDLLQEKLKQSEDNRQQLQKELQQILQRRGEHDKSVRAKLRQKYQSFLDEQERRNERNQLLMQMLERIDQQSAALSARSERLKAMKLQYERYFAKLMQTQPARCMQNTAVTADAMRIAPMTAAAQIPVLLNAAQPTTTTGVGEQKSEPMTAPITAPVEGITLAQPAALTPRMWTFAMATPTPAGLLLTGSPTAAMGAAQLQSTAAPFELLQYPLGYGTLLQQQQQQQLQMPFIAAQQSIGSVVFGNRGNVAQSYYDEASEALSRLNKYGGVENSSNSYNAPKSTETATTIASSTPGEGAGVSSKDRSEQHDHYTSRSVSTETEPRGGEMYETSGVAVQTTPNQNSETLVNETSDKPTEYSAASVSTEPDSYSNDLTKNMSEVKLEDANSAEDTYMPYRGWGDGRNEPVTSAATSKSYEENFSEERPLESTKDSWHNSRPNNINTAEEHMRKIAEIERRYGIAEDDANNGNTDLNTDMDDNITLSKFKRFSEIVNSELNTTNEELPEASGTVDNQPWQPQSHTSPVEYTPKITAPASKPVSIDNIENAIYGELVNPQINDAKSPTLKTAAQGFFTELLGQQDTPDATGIEQQENDRIQNLAANADNTAPKYASYSTSIGENAALESSGDKFTSEALNSNQNEPQTQTTYATSSSELYQPTATTETGYGTVETTNHYSAEYPADPTADPNASHSSANQQQQEYTQQDYENYDASQYGNYDPNAYPGYIYDETTGQYVVDPQYVAPEGSAAEATYAAQDYSEQLPQEQLSYQSSQGQEANYTYEDNSYATVAAPPTPEATDGSATLTTGEAVNVPVSEPEPTATAPIAPPVSNAAKVLKPTSILATADKHAAANDAQKKKKRVNFVDSSETDDSTSVKLAAAGAAGNDSDFDFSSGAETSVG